MTARMAEQAENLRALEGLLEEFFSPSTDNTRKAAIEKVLFLSLAPHFNPFHRFWGPSQPSPAPGETVCSSSATLQVTMWQCSGHFSGLLFLYTPFPA